MKLSAEWFQDLSTALSDERATDKERRRSSRVRISTRLPISLVVKGEVRPPVPIMVRDFSPRGINILFPEALRAGQQFTVRLKGAKGSIVLLCTALHCVRVADGMHSVGAEFTCVLPSSGAKQDGAETVERIRKSMMEN